MNYTEDAIEIMESLEGNTWMMKALLKKIANESSQVFVQCYDDMLVEEFGNEPTLDEKFFDWYD